MNKLRPPTSRNARAVGGMRGKEDSQTYFSGMARALVGLDPHSISLYLRCVYVSATLPPFLSEQTYTRNAHLQTFVLPKMKKVRVI